METPKTLGQWIKQKRSSKRWTLAQVAARAKKSSPYISSLERDTSLSPHRSRRQPRRETVDMIAAAFAESSDELPELIREARVAAGYAAETQRVVAHPGAERRTTLLMDFTSDIQPLDSLAREPNHIAALVKESGRPMVLTEGGRAHLVLMDVETYQDMLDAIDRAEAIQGIRAGLQSMSRGEGVPARKALEAIRQKHGLSG